MPLFSHTIYKHYEEFKMEMKRYSPAALQAALSGYSVGNAFPDAKTPRETAIFDEAKKHLKLALEDWGSIAVQNDVRKGVMQQYVITEGQNIWEMHCRKEIDKNSGTYQMTRDKQPVKPADWARLQAWKIMQDLMFKN